MPERTRRRSGTWHLEVVVLPSGLVVLGGTPPGSIPWLQWLRMIDAAIERTLADPDGGCCPASLGCDGTTVARLDEEAADGD